MASKELTGKELIEEVKNELKKSIEKGKVIKIPCAHGTIVWGFNPRDLLAWLEGKYEIYAERSLCEFVVVNNETGEAKLYREMADGPEVYASVRPLNLTELKMYLRGKTNNREEIIRIMISNWYTGKIFGQSHTTTKVQFP